MGEGSRKCIPALKYWAFYSWEKFSHITGSQDYFLITQKHLWDNDPHMWLEFLEILHFYFTLFVVLILSIFFSCGTVLLYLERCCFLSHFRAVWEGWTWWGNGEMLSYRQTHLTNLSGQWMTYRSIVLSFFLKHFQNAMLFFFSFKDAFS